MSVNITLSTSLRGNDRTFRVNAVRLGLGLVLGLAVLLSIAVYIGTRLMDNGQANLDDWHKLISQQQSEIASTRLEAEVELDALTLRIGQMQAQMLRLNALGERLVARADLDDDEFNFNDLPALGGPTELRATESVNISDFVGMLDQLDSDLDHRYEMLSVLEVLLMNRSLRDRVMPSGKPVEEGWLSSRYGRRSDPFTGKQDYHKGLDFAAREGTDILAVGDGIVSWSGRRTGYGRLVEIDHGNGYVTRYGHNRYNLVDVGETVKKGQQIALMGSSGRSTGPHVHFEVLHNGKHVDPARYISE